MEPQAEPARVVHVLPGLHPSSRSPDSFGSYRTPPTAVAAPPERFYGTISPSQPASSSASASEGVQLPSLRTLISPDLLNPAAPNASPAPVTRLPSLSGFDSTSTSSNGHGYSAREDSKATSNPAQSVSSVSSAPQPYPVYTPASSVIAAPVSDVRLHAPPTELSHRFLRRGSISSGASAGSENQSPREDANEGSALRVKRRIVDISRGSTRAARCVGQQQVAGEGMCYVYEDGSYCRTVIDGEAVNPQWGVTKAGKPRKRLAQACLTCREKKIKCEPGVPKCAQCTRARRTCRGGLSGQSPNTDGMKLDLLETIATPTNQQGDALSAHHSPPHQSQRATSPSSRGFLKPQRMFDEMSKPGDADEPRKRRYRSTSSDEREALGSAFAPQVPTDAVRSSAMHAMARSGLDSDPYEADSKLTRKLLDLYFNYVNSSTYAVFAREPFMNWVTNSQPKTADEKLVIYSLLVMGNVFSTDPEWRRTEKQLLDICNSGLQKRVGKFTVHMCLSRMYIGLAHFARGRHEEAWDWCGSFLRAISALKLNLEEGVACDDSESLFGFDRRMSEECKQRTFWAGFLMDRYNGFSGGTLFMIDADDVCVRLPCSKAAYDAGRPLETPIFDGGHIEERALLRNISPMGYHALVSAIWGDVWIFTARAARKHASMRLHEYNQFYDQTNERLDEWLACLPLELQYNESNLYSAINAGYAGTFVGMHALHQAAIMRLNRYARHSSLPPHILSRNAYRANATARNLLCRIIAPVTESARSQRLGPKHPFAFATPFPGYAVLIATDILSAGGLASDMATTIEAIGNGLECVDEIASFWCSARTQKKAIETRLRFLASIAIGEASRFKKFEGHEVWRLDKALESNFAGRDDVVYGADDETFFAALLHNDLARRREVGASMMF
ncbi:c6 transcription factor [Diplodia corticola]|uniref:C6 transcription factor n=1 Tax=Diplodia corticola TaxID=236234 RepID=A0A1J9QWR9_9PEZI|nr:c6 transcription factor [Diplodia corticola]OJD33438.1 c6 transcription factor [Diplodia corticola]